VYIPLGGSSGAWHENKERLSFFGKWFWHGANWTFIAWGFINALYFLPLLLLNKNRSNMEAVSLLESSVRVFFKHFKHLH
jgi:D-alanyl-lipoteichoic acid acyltransferase DltB (MBOAT superfamily)